MAINNVEKHLDGYVQDAMKRYRSVAIGEVLETSDGSGREYITVSFDDAKAATNPHFVGQPRLFKKAFFSDTHSLAFLKAKQNKEVKDGYIEMDMLRAIVDCDPYHVLDENGEKREDQDGNAVIAKSVAIFIMDGENLKTEYRRQMKTLARQKRFVSVSDPDEPEILEEEKEAALTKGKK